MAKATARVAGLLTVTTAHSAAEAATLTATITTVLSALTSNMAAGPTLVAFLASRTTAKATLVTTSSGVGTFAGQMANVTTTVARFFLLWSGAFTTHVTILSAVVTHWSPTLGAVTSLVSSLATIVAGTTASSTTTGVVVASVLH